MLTKTYLTHTRYSLPCTITKLWLMLSLCEDILLNKKLSGRWFETSWRSYNVTVITMLQKAVSVLQLITSPARECIMFSLLLARTCCWKTVEWPVIWNVMTAMLRHCNNIATKRDFAITNDFISNERAWRFPLLISSGIIHYKDYVSRERVWMFLLLLARACCWTIIRWDADLGRHNAHVASL